MARDATTITAADVLRLIDGPIGEVQGSEPATVRYDGPAEHLRDVWIAVVDSVLSVLERVTLADIVSGRLPTNPQVAVR